MTAKNERNPPTHFCRKSCNSDLTVDQNSIFSHKFNRQKTSSDEPKSGDSKIELTLWNDKPAANWLEAMPLWKRTIGSDGLWRRCRRTAGY